MLTVSEVVEFLQDYAPLALAEDWDNVGLLVGRHTQKAARIMTCLTVTAATAAEAIEERADLIITHHPLPFRPLKRITGDSVEGRMLLDLIAAKVAVYSAHTAFDSAQEGINERLSKLLDLRDGAALVPSPHGALAPLGAGRIGFLPTGQSSTVSSVVKRLKKSLRIDRLQVVGDPNRKVRCVAVACGSAGEFLQPAVRMGCDCFVTGETRFHTSLEAEAAGVGMVLLGHYASERFGVEALADVMSQRFPKSTIWASQQERDPLRWM